MPGIEGLLIGRVLGGRYRIEEVIGRGGMGAVYRAVDERLGRQVAVKVITVSGSGEADARERLRARFFREARSAAALPHHPNVVPVYDYGSDDALGLDYIVMELLRGSDLATRLGRSGAPPLTASLKILLEAARGLAVGHRQGLIHRDVKPGNIFLAQTHSNEVQVRVVDFGIAKLADDEDTLAQLTQDGRVPHSPAYASPEQLRGLTQLTPASDVFSLGAVGFQLLTGERPFTESDRNRMSLGMPVEAPPVRTRNPAVPGATEAVISRALASDPQDRFADAGAMADALEEAIRSMPDAPIDPYLAGVGAAVAGATEEEDRTQLAEVEDDRTLLAPPVSGYPERASTRQLPPRMQAPPAKHPRRERAGVGGIFVWALVLVALVAAGLWGWSEIQQASTATFDIPPAPDTLPLVTPDQPIDEPPEPTLLDADINDREGRRLYALGRYDSALVAFRRAVGIDPNSATYRRNYAVTLLRLGLAEEAERELTRVISLNPNLAVAYANLADARLVQGDTTGAIAALEDHLARETNNVAAGRSERLLRDLQRAQAGPTLPPLLGDTVFDGDPIPEQPAPGPEQQPISPPDTADVDDRGPRPGGGPPPGRP